MSLLGNVQLSRLGVCHRVQLGVCLKVCSGVPLRSFRELTWERIVKQAGRAPLSGIGSVLESMPGSVLGSVLRA